MIKYGFCNNIENIRLDNKLNNEEYTTGDHDGIANIIILIETFRRLSAAGRVIYVRFLGEDGTVIATRSTGKMDEKSA
jgi:hypothetical protein